MLADNQDPFRFKGCGEAGDVTLQPGLVAQLQREFSQPLQSEYAEQFTKAMAVEVGVKRDDEAIEAARKRIVGGNAGN